MGRGISWKVAGMHPDRRAEFHEVGHWRGLIVAAPGYMAAGSCIGVNDSSVSVDNQPEAPRLMIYIFVENSETTSWGRPTRFTRSDGGDQCNSALLYKRDSLIGQIDDYPGLRSQPLASQQQCR